MRSKADRKIEPLTAYREEAVSRTCRNSAGRSRPGSCGGEFVPLAGQRDRAAPCRGNSSCRMPAMYPGYTGIALVFGSDWWFLGMVPEPQALAVANLICRWPSQSAGQCGEMHLAGCEAACRHRSNVSTWVAIDCSPDWGKRLHAAFTEVAVSRISNRVPG